MPFVISNGQVTEVATRAQATDPTVAFGITTYRSITSTYATIWRTQPNVRTVVDFIARQFGQLAHRLLEEISEAERRHVRDHPLDRLLRRPHPNVSPQRFYRTLAADQLIFDNYIALKVRLEGSTESRALVRVPASSVEPVGGDFATPAGYRILGTSTVFGEADVVHVAGYNPADARWGVSPIETLRRVLAEDLAAGEAREQFWERAARFGNGWIQRPADAPEWSAPARERFDNSWRDTMTGDGPEAGGTPVLEEGMAFHAETFDAQAAQYLEARKLSKAEVASAYHLHPSLIGFVDAAAGVREVDRRSLIADNLAPLADFVDGELLTQLLGDYEEDTVAAFDRFVIAADLDVKLRGDFLAEAEATSRAVGAPWMTRNEARARRALPPADGGDELITPLNVTTGGRASPADTAPGTPGLGQAATPGPRALAAGERRLELVRPELVKAVEDLPPSLQTWAEHHATVVADHAARQEARYRSRIGAGYTPEQAFKAAQADEELGGDLAGIALELAPEAAAPVAERFGIDYDLTASEGGLVSNAYTAAGNYNSNTLAGLLDPNADTAAVFALAAGARAVQFGIARTTTVRGLATHDAATQGGAGTKRWRVNSRNPRRSHAALNNVTIGMAEDFNVGGYTAPWPCHANLPAGEVAGCTCSVDFA